MGCWLELWFMLPKFLFWIFVKTWLEKVVEAENYEAKYAKTKLAHNKMCSYRLSLSWEIHTHLHWKPFFLSFFPLFFWVGFLFDLSQPFRGETDIFSDLNAFIWHHRSTSHLGGWNKSERILMVGFSLLLDTLVYLVFILVPFSVIFVPLICVLLVLPFLFFFFLKVDCKESYTVYGDLCCFIHYFIMHCLPFFAN